MVLSIRLATLRQFSLMLSCVLGSIIVAEGAAIAQSSPEDALLAPLPPATAETTETMEEPSIPELSAPLSEDYSAPLPAPTPRVPPQPLPTAPLPPGHVISSYILGPGDQIGISVVGFTELERNRIVLPDGTILLPLIGPVMAAGKTLEDLETEITQRLSFYLIEPVVELNLAVLRPIVITVGGEVNRPGPVQLNSLSTFNTQVDNNAQLNSEITAPTLSTALVGAGGVRRTADLRQITVQRQLPNGQQTTLTVNLWESIFQGGAGENILLQDRDIVFVPKAPEEADIDSQLVARSSLAPEVVRVRVVGEVLRPGEVQIPPDSSVSAAVAVAGGHDTETADLANVTLLRLADNGQVLGQTINLDNFTNPTPIQDGDVIVVPKRGYLNVLDNISRTLQPITAPFNFFLLLDRVFQ